MKQLLLTSPDPASKDAVRTSTWNNYLDDGFDIKPYSKVGIKSASIPISDDIINIETAQTFYWQPQGALSVATKKTIVVPIGIYNLSTLLTLMNNLIVRSQIVSAGTGASAANIPIIKRQMGTIFRFSRTVKNNRQNVSSFFNKVAQDNFDGLDLTQSANMAKAGNTWNRTGGGTDTSCFVYTIKPLIASCGYMRAQITVLGACMIGLSNSLIAPVIDMPDTSFTYAMGIDSVTGNMVYKDKDGVRVDSGVAVVANDYLSIELSGGRIRYCMYRDASEDPLPGSIFPAPGDEFDYFDIATQYNNILRLENAAVRAIPVCILDPRATIDVNGTMFMDEDQLEGHDLILSVDPPGYIPPIGAPPAPAGAAAGNFILYFSNDAADLARILGYSAAEYLVYSVRGSFDAQLPFLGGYVPNNLIIEIHNLNLESYDTTQGKNQRRNIIGVLPNLDYKNNCIVYDTSTPLMLDINNMQPLSMRQFVVSVYSVRSNSEALMEMAGRAQLVLVFEG